MQKKLRIKGMHCASCAANIKKSLEKKEAVSEADINYATALAMVEFDESKIQLPEIIQIIEKLAYGAEELTAGKEEMLEEEADPKPSIIAIILTVPLFMRMFVEWNLPGNLFGISLTHWTEFVLAGVVVFWFGLRFHTSAWNQLKQGQSNMDSLVSLGTLSAFFYSAYAMFAGGHLYFESAAMITALILLGKYFEARSRGRAGKALQKLLQLGAKEATVIRDNKEEKVSLDQIRKGDIILVKPGEKIALDGEIVEGATAVDQAMLTGESLPAEKQKGDKVFGATINKESAVKIRVEKTGEDTMLAQIVKTVEEAQRFKAPIQKLADKIAGIFVPAVIVIAIFTLIGWLIAGAGSETAIINAVTVLIIACPCALGIATPAAIMVGTSVGARQGVLIKNGDSFEKIKDIQAIIFDKTGTLTEGEPSLSQTITAPEAQIEEKQALSQAASLATNSDHPYSKAVVDKAKSMDLQIEAAQAKEISGHGLATDNLLLGNIKLLKQNNLPTDWAESTSQEIAKQGASALFLADKNKVLAAFSMKDALKQGAKEAVAKAKDLELKTYLISGDSAPAVKAIAGELGIDNYMAEVLPNDKQAEVKKLQDKGEKVIFVGDGINDAPSLTQADLGIAMAGGTDIAKEAGNIIIMNDQPLLVPKAIDLSRNTFKVIKQNLFWAFAYNTLAIPLAIAGLVNPMIAAGAMSFSSISVLINSLRLYRFNKK